MVAGFLQELLPIIIERGAHGASEPKWWLESARSGRILDRKSISFIARKRPAAILENTIAKREAWQDPYARNWFTEMARTLRLFGGPLRLLRNYWSPVERWTRFSSLMMMASINLLLRWSCHCGSGSLMANIVNGNDSFRFDLVIAYRWSSTQISMQFPVRNEAMDWLCFLQRLSTLLRIWRLKIFVGFWKLISVFEDWSNLKCTKNSVRISLIFTNTARLEKSFPYHNSRIAFIHWLKK